MERINIAVQHVPDIGFEDLHRLVWPSVAAALDELSCSVDVPARLDGDTLRLNGIGDFSCGGPNGDNGLSGKKLVVDHYGPQVPIGGGALCGKDPHKPDRVGPLRARQLAVRLADATGQAATVHLGWLPGLEAPDRLHARLADGTALDADDVAGLVSVPDLTLAGSARDLELATVPWPDGDHARLHGRWMAVGPMTNARQRPRRYVLGSDPYGDDGWPVLLSEGSASHYKEILDIVASSRTMREFVESMERFDGGFSIEEFEDEELDEPFDLELVPGYGDGLFPPDPRTWMLDDLNDDLFDVLDDLLTIYDNMGSNPIAVIQEADVGEIRSRLTAAGYEIVGWDALA